jgi:hypothetical protein
MFGYLRFKIQAPRSIGHLMDAPSRRLDLPSAGCDGVHDVRTPHETCDQLTYLRWSVVGPYAAATQVSTHLRGRHKWEQESFHHTEPSFMLLTIIGY